MTPLQWVVLAAYARVLPTDSDTRQIIDAALSVSTPAPSGQRVAVTLAEASGMLEQGRITEFGRQAVRRYLPTLKARGTA